LVAGFPQLKLWATIRLFGCDEYLNRL